MNKVTAVDELISAIVTALKAAVSYPVFDGPIDSMPGRSEDRFVVVGADKLQTDPSDDTDYAESATVQQEWTGLGQVARSEQVGINCIAVGRGWSKSVAYVRGVAKAVVDDVASNLGIHPTAETYGALVSEISAIQSRNTSGGAIVQAHFVISVSARLT